MARQPILNRKGEISAYEILYRRDSTSVGGPLDDRDEHRAMLNAVVEIGLGRLTGDKPAFFNVSSEMLGSVAASLLPADRVVLELLEDTVLDERTALRLKSLKEQGYVFAYDDFTFQPHQLAFIEHVDLIKVDVMDAPWPTVALGMARLKASGARLLAEKVEDRQTYERCLAAGFDLFQGYYFSRPQTLTTKGINVRERGVLRLLSTLSDPDATIADLTLSISQDATLAASLFKLVNSVAFGAPRKIASIQAAIQVLGTKRLQAFATVLAASGTSVKDTRPLGELGLVRARMCEEVARQFGHADPQMYFTIGLLSVLDAIMNLPMEQIVGELALPDEILATLLDFGRSEEMQIVLALERGDRTRFDRSSLDVSRLMRTYVQAVEDTVALS